MSYLHPANLHAINSLALTDGNFIVGDGSSWVAESGGTVRTSLGLAIGTDVQAYDAQLADISALAVTDGNIMVGDGANWVAENGATARTSLGVAIGTDVQAYDAQLADIAGLATTDGGFIVGDGANFVLETAATARTSIGLGTGDSPTFTNGIFSGNLTVQGTTTTVDSETVLLRANYQYMNQDYVTDAAQAGGFVVNYNPTASTTNTTDAGVFAAGVDGVSDPTITTAGSGTFSAADVIQLSGSASGNDGLYEVQGHSGITLTIRSTDAGVTNRVEDWTLDDWTNTTTDTAITITKVNVSVLRVGTDGNWEVGAGATTGITYSDISALTAGDGIDIAAGTISTDLKASGGLKIDTTELAVEPADFAGTGLEDDGSDNLRIAAAAAGNGLTGGGGSALAVGAGTGIVVNAADIAVDQTFAFDFDGLITTDGRKLGLVAKTGAYTAASADDDVIVCDNSTAYTITLPAVSGLTGQRFTIKNDGSHASNAITVDGNASETIDGALTAVIGAFGALTVVCDGSAWQII